MATCVIILGWDSRSPLQQLPPLPPGANVICVCNPCPATRRVVFDGAPGAYSMTLLNNAEVKPAETYVITFGESGDADAWLNANAGLLIGKTIYRVSPAITTF